MKWLNHQQTGLTEENKCSKIIYLNFYTPIKDDNNVIRLVLGKKKQAKAKSITETNPTEGSGVYIVKYENKHKQSRYFTILDITEITKKSTLTPGWTWFVCKKALKLNSKKKKDPTKKVEHLYYTQTGTIVM